MTNARVLRRSGTDGSATIESIVAAGMCIGCGVCVGVCPRPESAMHLVSDGLWRPELQSDRCRETCGRCAAVCPFAFDSATEVSVGRSLFAADPSTAWDDILGWWSQCFAGAEYNDESRIRAASGGIVTRILVEALESGLVQRVAAVSAFRPATQDFGYELVESPADIRRLASSRYFPVHFADVLREVLESRCPTAVVALPCQAKALRFAMAADSRLAEAIVLIVGLACGQMKTALFTRQLASKNLGTAVLGDIRYRVKHPEASAYDYEYELAPLHGDAVVSVTSSEIGPLWESRWNSAYPCCFCDDVFAECADVVVMDAWVEPYCRDGRGTSLVVTRSSSAQTLLEGEVAAGNVSVVDAAVILASQAGAISDKRTGVAIRERMAQLMRRPWRRKRITERRLGLAQTILYSGAYLNAASCRQGESRAGRALLRSAGAFVCGLGRMVSTIAMALRRQTGRAL